MLLFDATDIICHTSSCLSQPIAGQSWRSSKKSWASLLQSVSRLCLRLRQEQDATLKCLLQLYPVSQSDSVVCFPCCEHISLSYPFFFTTATKQACRFAVTFAPTQSRPAQIHARGRLFAPLNARNETNVARHDVLSNRIYSRAERRR